MNRISNIALLIIGIILAAGCGKPSAIGEESTQTVPKSDTLTKEYQTKSGKKFVMTEDRSTGASIVEVSIETREFEAVNDTYQLGKIDPVENIFLADLDSNGFEELYITTRSAGSGSYSFIYGFASNRDKSVSQIYIPESTDMDKDMIAYFEGYMGHNTFSIEKGVLTNQFPIYTEADTNAKPTGGSRKVFYTLKHGEASWILSPSKMENVND